MSTEKWEFCKSLKKAFSWGNTKTSHKRSSTEYIKADNHLKNQQKRESLINENSNLRSEKKTATTANRYRIQNKIANNLSLIKSAARGISLRKKSRKNRRR